MSKRRRKLPPKVELKHRDVDSALATLQDTIENLRDEFERKQEAFESDALDYEAHIADVEQELADVYDERREARKAAENLEQAALAILDHFEVIPNSLLVHPNPVIRNLTGLAIIKRKK